MAKESFKFELKGAKEFTEVLEGLPLKMEASILRSVNREGAKIVLKELRDNAPTEELRKGLVIRSDREDLTGVILRPSRKIYFARFYEYGTKVRQTESGANRGQITPQPFIRKGIDNSVGRAIKYISENYGQLIEKHLKRALKRVNKKLGK